MKRENDLEQSPKPAPASPIQPNLSSGSRAEAGRTPGARRAIAVLEPFLTIAETAALLQVSSKTIRRHIQDGRLLAHRIGTQWRIARYDLDLYLRNARRGK